MSEHLNNLGITPTERAQIYISLGTLNKPLLLKTSLGAGIAQMVQQVGCELDNQGIGVRFPAGITSRPTLEPTQPPIQRIPWYGSPRSKAAGA
jgi:hypothetical protein